MATKNQPPVHDPLWGELVWHPASREWMGRVWLTPKHPVEFSVYDPDLEEGQTWEEELAPTRAAHLANLPREWEFRLALAEELIADGKVSGPAEEVARRAVLDSIRMYYTRGDCAWHYLYHGEGKMAEFPAHINVDPDGTIDVNF